MPEELGWLVDLLAFSNGFTQRNDAPKPPSMTLAKGNSSQAVPRGAHATKAHGATAEADCRRFASDVATPHPRVNSGIGLLGFIQSSQKQALLHACGVFVQSHRKIPWPAMRVLETRRKKRI